MRARVFLFLTLVFWALAPNMGFAQELVLWHSYRGQEQRALNALLLDWNAQHPDTPVRPLAVPHGAYGNKLSTAIPRGHGPDLFIYAHERVGDWVRAGLISTVDEALTGEQMQRFLPGTLHAFTWKGGLYGIPLAAKSLALFYNRALVADPPRDTDELLAFMESWQNPAGYPLAYETGSFYHHAPWFFGFGGELFNEQGEATLYKVENEASFDFVASLTRRGFVPREATAASVAQLFNDQRAAMVVSGPWFLGEIQGVDYGVAPLPMVQITGRAATPFLTVEGVLISSRSLHSRKAGDLARYLALGAGARLRLLEGGQLVADQNIYDELGAALPETLRQFKAQMAQTTPMPNNPLMRSVWEPGARALRSVLRGARTPREALARAQREVEIVSRARPEAHDPTPYLILLFLLGLLGSCWVFLKFRGALRAGRPGENLAAYAYLAPAAVGITVLVLVPFLVGTAVAFFAHREGSYTFVGVSNFQNILLSDDYAITDPLSFYFTLAVTVLWTSANVALHLILGLTLAMVLRNPWVRCRGLFRVLLIVPWAVPNYITALIWKGLFHSQFGAINALLGGLGLTPIPWFSQFWTSFAANLITNTWLGFPFMMVVCLGALQAIPKELEEAAEMDGASGWTRFTQVIFPLIKPALIPAVILGSVWTFNMFNIIYLVSGGEPDGATEILITEAYRWAFHRQEQYGYAAAYAVLIFVALIGYTLFTRRIASVESP